MADGLSIQIRGLEPLLRNLGSFPGEIEAELTATTWQATQQLEAHVKPLTPVDLGPLRSSYGSSVRPLAGGGVRGAMGTNMHYAPYIEYGTRPHWPPLAALEGWAARHGVPAFVVARAIARRGTKAVRMFAQTLEAQRDNINALYNRTVAALVARFGR